MADFIPGEIIIGTSSNETLLGSNGDDMIDHGGGSDIIDGADGIDTLIFNHISGYFTIWTLDGVTRVTGAGINRLPAIYADQQVLLTNVEQIRFLDRIVPLSTTPLNVILGTSASESIVGTDNDDVIDHFGGNDVINGGAGADTVVYFQNSTTISYTFDATSGLLRVNGGGRAAPYDLQEVLMFNVETIQFLDKRVSFGGSADDTLRTWSGVDTVNGGAGVDTVVYGGASSSYALSRTASGFTVSGAPGDTDTLQNVELFQFSDLNLAFDFTKDTPLYNTVLMGAAAAGVAYINDPALFGGGVRFAEQFGTMQELADAVIDLGIYDHLNNREFVQLINNNVQHVASDGEIDFYERVLDFGIDRSQVLRIFAESDYNVQSVDLVGLQQTGIEFV